jgi:hypothetical protein
MASEIGVPYDLDEEDKENKVYMTLSLAKYPFLKNKKRGEKGEASFTAEIEKSETHQESEEGHHTIVFHDLMNIGGGKRI